MIRFILLAVVSLALAPTGLTAGTLFNATGAHDRCGFTAYDGSFSTSYAATGNTIDCRDDAAVLAMAAAPAAEPAIFPHPATLLLMLGGVGLIGLGLRDPVRTGDGFPPA